MKINFVSLLLFVSCSCFGQNDSNQTLRAFPITDYILDLTDSTKLVQLEMPDIVILKDGQVGMLWGTFNETKEEAVQKGYGKCYLIKGNYYYFAIGNNTSGLNIKKGDLLYTFMETTKIYNGIFPKLASHFIRLQDVYEEPFYDRYLIYLKWAEEEENKVIDSMIKDIKFTGHYFIENDPSMDKLIDKGKYAGKKTLSLMSGCKKDDLMDFFEYVLVRPRIYAGREWKVSEIFATWLSEGAPTIEKD